MNQIYLTVLSAALIVQLAGCAGGMGASNEAVTAPAVAASLGHVEKYNYMG